jgi:hypothetical protein
MCFCVPWPGLTPLHLMTRISFELKATVTGSILCNRSMMCQVQKKGTSDKCEYTVPAVKGTKLERFPLYNEFD